MGNGVPRGPTAPCGSLRRTGTACGAPRCPVVCNGLQRPATASTPPPRGLQWTPVASNASSGPQWSPMVSNGPQWSPMVPNGPQWSPM
eukprot:7790662-Lingulodinium_polyedra.AAC.1